MKQRTNCATLSALMLLAISQVGCWTPKFNQGPITAAKPSVAADQVKIFHAGSAPGTSYEVVSALSCEGYTKDNYEPPMREFAGRLGADAVVGVRNFSAPRVIGSRYQSGIAVRLLNDVKALPPSEAKSGVAMVILVGVPTKDDAELTALRETIEVAAAGYLHWAGYCPIHVSAKMPSGTNLPSKATFDLLKGTEASVCEKMLVLRLLSRGADVEMAAELQTRQNEVIWSAQTTTGLFSISDILFEPLIIATTQVVVKSLTAKSSTRVFDAVMKTLRKLPKNPSAAT